MCYLFGPLGNVYLKPQLISTQAWPLSPTRLKLKSLLVVYVAEEKEEMI
jgi:hypothetical protein